MEYMSLIGYVTIMIIFDLPGTIFFDKQEGEILAFSNFINEVDKVPE